MTFFTVDFHMSSLHLNIMKKCAELVPRFQISPFDLRFHVLLLTIPDMNSKQVSRSGVDDSSFLVIPHFW